MEKRKRGRPRILPQYIGPRGNHHIGRRMAHFRGLRGITQPQLAKAVGVSTRVISYYETESPFTFGFFMNAVSDVLRVSQDLLLGLRPFDPDVVQPYDLPLQLRLVRLGKLPEDRKAVLERLIEAYLTGSGLVLPPPPPLIGTERTEDKAIITDPMFYGRRIRAFRKLRRISRPRLSMVMGFPKKTLVWYETTLDYNICEFLIKIMDALRITADELYGSWPILHSETKSRNQKLFETLIHQSTLPDDHRTTLNQIVDVFLAREVPQRIIQRRTRL